VTKNSIADLWNRVLGTQPPPTRQVAIAVGVAALLAVGYRPAWRISRNAVTIAHEGGHAVVALVTGRRLAGIRLHSDTSGVTVSYGRPTGFGMVLTLIAGYVTPPLLGLGGAWLLAAGHITALLWVCILLLVAVLLVVRNVFGVLSVAFTGAAVFAVSWFASARVQGGFAYLVVWFLLLGGVRPVLELGQRRGRGRGGSDADQLARLTRTPAALWVMFFGTVAVACLVAGGRWLVHL
jgi:hypothetical protein